MAASRELVQRRVLVLPRATSVDGRTFSFYASLDDLPFQLGGYVVQVGGGERWLGQILTLEVGLIEVNLNASSPGA